jgi:hypothetical protein
MAAEQAGKTRIDCPEALRMSCPEYKDPDE